MRVGFVVIVALGALVFTQSLSAQEEYAGEWKMTSMSLAVSIDSWGDNCGPKPQSYSSKSARPVTITARGKHLVFSSGGIRTDRCGSPNPRVHTASEQRWEGNWKRVCQTYKADPKYERGEYHLKAVDENRLEYRAISKFDWTLKGDHCVARSTEKRVYVRTGKRPSSSKAREEPEPEPAVPSSRVNPFDEPVDEELLEMDESDSACVLSSSIQKVSVYPSAAQIGPGEEMCFRAVATDVSGCRRSAVVAWSVTQGGRPVSGLITRKGCFVAGETAAESEGRYEVIGRLRGRSGTAQLDVVFVDLADLFAARLPIDHQPGAGRSPSEEPAPAEETSSPSGASAPAKPSQPAVAPIGGAPPATPPPAAGGRSSSTLAVALLVLAALIICVVVVLLLVMRARNARQADDEFDDWPEEPESIGGGTPQEVEITCPKCGNEYPASARFCPIDGAPLHGGKKEDPSARNIPGMICPECHRAYDSDARFCPHDSAALVEYAVWREQNR
jgi:hypothetical protein